MNAASTPHTYPSLRAAWIPLAALCMAFFVEMVDNSLLSIALPTIGRDLGAGTRAPPRRPRLPTTPSPSSDLERLDAGTETATLGRALLGT